MATKNDGYDYDVWTGRKHFGSLRPPTDKNAVLSNTNPHYSDEKFNNKVGWKPQTIFGIKSRDLHYVYSDRVWQWNYDRAQEAEKIADAKHERKTANWYEAYLSHFFDKPVSIQHIMAGVNVSNGYSYLVFGYCEE